MAWAPCDAHTTRSSGSSSCSACSPMSAAAAAEAVVVAVREPIFCMELWRLPAKCAVQREAHGMKGAVVGEKLTEGQGV